MNQKKRQTPSTARTANMRTRRGRGNRTSGGSGEFSLLAHRKSVIPTPTETENKTWDVIEWGKNNLYPYYLNFLAKSNPIHSGVLGSKVFYTISGGLIYDGNDTEAWNSFNKNQSNKFGDQTVEDMMPDTSLNLETSNMFCFAVKFNQVGKEKKYRKIDLIPFETIRFEYKTDDNNRTVLTGNIKVSSDWSDSKLEPTTIHPYIEKGKNGYEDQRVFYILKSLDSGQSLDTADGRKVNPGFYPTPSYSGAITDIDTGIEIGKYNNAEIHNGFSLGTIINANNGKIKDHEKKKEFEQGIKGATTGANASGGTMISYNNGKDKAVTVESLNGNNLPERYTNTKKGSTESTLHGHSVTAPILFGVKTESSLGNATELQTGYAVMKANYFAARQRSIESVLNWIGKTIIGLQGTISFGSVSLQLESQLEEDGNKTSEALNNMSPLLANKVLEVMTPNEIRALGALDSVEGGDTLPEKSAPAAFSKEDDQKILDRLSSNGRSRDDLRIVKSYSLSDCENVSETACMDSFKSEFAAISTASAQVLNLITEGNNFNNILKAMDIDSLELARIYKSLISSEMMSSEGTITDLGMNSLAASDIDALEILYEYRLRADAPALIPGGETRDFCQTLLGLNRLYTRADIDVISGVEGYNVFAYRGGWYHDPNTEKNNPGCRHEWSQVVTFKN